jgi:predicted dehydrogenase
MKTRLRVGVVGVGHLGRHHARILAGLDGVELIGVADSRIEQAEAVGQPLGVPGFADYRELLDRVEAISVAVPTTLHRLIGGAFLERGIPTLIEKPLAASASEAEELVALARRSGALLQVGHIERYNPALSALTDARVRPRFVEADRLGTYTFRSTDIGVVHDLMIHDLDLVLSLVEAPVRSVAAVGVSVFGRHEDVANARVEFDDGCVANLTASRVSYQAVRKMRIWGDEGYVGLDFAARQGTLVRPSEALRRGELDIEGLDLTQIDAVRERIFGRILRVDKVQAEGVDQLTVELRDFVSAVRAGSRPRVLGEDALKSMRLADQILEALASHRWEDVPDGLAVPARADGPAPGGGLTGPHLWKVRESRNAPARRDRSF